MTDGGHRANTTPAPDDFVVIGYMIIQGCPLLKTPRPEYPPVLYTPTSCICTLHPDDDVLPWITNAAERNEIYRQHLDLSLEDLIDIQSATDAALEASAWGLDAVFADQETATQFFDPFFRKHADLRLIELSIRHMDLPEFLEATAPMTDSTGAQFSARGMHLAAQHKRSAAVDGRELGFETVGVNSSGDTHTSICYEVRGGFEQKGIVFNVDGFLAQVQHAVAGAQMNNDAEGGTVGDASWFAVRVADLARSELT